ncbi:MAG: SpoIIE family protein phosphatase, partial [Bacteroidia bacterium]|nr:SpoIIE family protein phosphatase [Bacteroidia bacterium]
MSGIASALANPSTCMLLIGKLCIAVYTDITFCIKQVNEAFTKHTGLDREQVLDKNLFDFFSLYNNENTIDEFLADLSSQNIAHAVLKLKFEDDVKWVDLYGTADRDYRNQINGFLIAGTVIDAHKKLEQLEQNELIKNYQRDLDIAQSYIQGLLPSPELFKRVNPNALLIYMPMRGIGGDWYWFKIEKNRTHFLMGDVMGHGVNAGIVSTLVASALSHFKDWHQIARPTDLVQLVHKSVYPIIKYNPSITEDFSMDIVTAIFYPETRELLYTSGNFSILAQRGNTFLD